jgi:hypothetical protein
MRLDALFAKIGALPEDDLELRSHWARYLCVLASGYLEVATREILVEVARAQGAPVLVRFVAERLADFQNPKMEKILGLVGDFSLEWESELRARSEGEIKDAVDSIVDNRHKIAHGENVGISYAVIERYWVDAKRAMQDLAEVTGVV